MKSLLCFFPVDKDPALTGAPRTVLNLLSELRKNGFRLILVTQHESQLTDRLREREIEVEILHVPPILDVFDEGIFDYSWIDKAKAFRAVLAYNREIMQIANAYNVDGIWARQVKGVLLAGFASLWSRRPLVWDIGVEKESRGLVYLLHTLGLFLANKIVTQAQMQPNEIFGERRRQWFQSKFEPINPGIDDSRRYKIEHARKNRQKNDTIEIITIGSVHPRKNQRMLLKVLPSIVSVHDNILVRVVGPFRDEEYAAGLRRFVQAKGLEEHVHFLGWRDDVPELLGVSDIFVLCSRAEGVPQVIREAMYAQLPTIATAVGGVPEAVQHGETGFLVLPDDLGQMKKHLLTLVKDPKKRGSMGASARQYAENRFSKENWISTYVNMLRELD